MMKSSEMDNTFVPNPNYIYKIIPEYVPNLCFEIKDGKTDNGANVQLGDSQDVPYQYFKIIPVEKTKCIIQPVHCNDKVIDVTKGKMKIRTNIQLFNKLNLDQQYFHIVEAGKDTYSILSCVDENFCLDIHARGKKKGSNVQLYTRNFSIAQIFKIVGKRNIYNSIEYALKYATERNPEFKKCDPNCANFCSQCLLVGGVEPDKIWDKDTETFTDVSKFKSYFYDKGIEWTEFPGYNDINPGDIAFMQSPENKFDHPIFVIRKSNSQVIFCGNSIDIKEGSLNFNLIGAVLKTSSLFK